MSMMLKALFSSSVSFFFAYLSLALLEAFIFPHQARAHRILQFGPLFQSAEMFQDVLAM